MKTYIITFIVAAFVLNSLQGCTSSGTSNNNLRPNERRNSTSNSRTKHKKHSKTKKEAIIKLSGEGRIYVGSKYTGLKKMVKQLKADGVKTDDRIIIKIPPHTSPNALKSIGRELASNGYGYVHFRQELKPSAKTGADPLIKHIYE